MHQITKAREEAVESKRAGCQQIHNLENIYITNPLDNKAGIYRTIFTAPDSSINTPNQFPHQQLLEVRNSYCNSGTEATVKHFQVGTVSPSPLFHSHTSLNTYVTCTWKITHLVKLQHSVLSRNLGLFPTSRRVGLKYIADFRMIQGLVARDSHLSSSGLTTDFPRMPMPTPWAPFLKPSLTGTYVACESVKLGVKPSSTLKLVTQTATGPPHSGLDLGPK